MKGYVLENVLKIPERICVLITTLVLSLVLSGPALAGGSEGAGIVTYNEVNSSAAGTFSSRHQKGLDYALDENSTFTGIAEEVIIKAALTAGGVPPNATDIVFAIKAQIERMDYASKNGLDAEFWASSVAEIVETVLVQTIPVVDIPLTALKLGAAFTTAYTYGYLFG